MERITEYLKIKGLRTAKIPLLDTPVYYGAADDYDIAFLVNPMGLPELTISTTQEQNEAQKSLEDCLSAIDLKGTYGIIGYHIDSSCMHFRFSSETKNNGELVAFMEWFLSLLKQYHATTANKCTVCGQEMNEKNSDWYNFSGTGICRHLHHKCRHRMEREDQQARALIFRKYPTYKRGIIGALIGAIPATLLCAVSYRFGDIAVTTGMSVVLLSWLGYIINCGFRGRYKPFLLYGISLCGMLLGYFLHPLFGMQLSEARGTDPLVLLFVGHLLAVFLLICIRIAEVVLYADNRKAGLKGVIKLRENKALTKE